MKRIYILVFGLIAFFSFNANKVLANPNSSARQERPEKIRDPYLDNQVRNTMMKRTKDVQTCYLKLLETNPQITEFNIKLDWHVEPNGKVRSPEVVFSGQPDEKFQKCMTTQVSKIIFPPVPDGKQKYVDYTFYFQKDGTPPKPPIVIVPTNKDKN